MKKLTSTLMIVLGSLTLSVSAATPGACTCADCASCAACQCGTCCGDCACK